MTRATFDSEHPQDIMHNPGCVGIADKSAAVIAAGGWATQRGDGTNSEPPS